MGYNTNFQGGFTVSPPMSDETVALVEAFAKERHEDTPMMTYPSIWCDWVTDGADAIEWNDAEKFYDADEWIEWLIVNILAPAGHTVSGEVFAAGDDPTDLWKIVVADNVVTRLEGKIIYVLPGTTDGPSDG